MLHLFLPPSTLPQSTNPAEAGFVLKAEYVNLRNFYQNTFHLFRSVSFVSSAVLQRAYFKTNRVVPYALDQSSYFALASYEGHSGHHLELGVITLFISRIPRDKQSPIQFCSPLKSGTECVSFELFHEQLPLPVPCYDLLPITELAVGRLAANFGHSRLS
jgi:hypothetical protein